MSAIKQIQASEIIDSSGYPTLKGRIILENGIVEQLEIPSPIRPDSNEPVALRDNEDRMMGMGMRKAAEIINKGISQRLQGASVLKQKEIDLWLNTADSSKRKEILGVSTINLVSFLVAKAAARVQNKPLFVYLNELYAQYFSKIKLEVVPTPIVTMINGGKFSNNLLDFKEFYILFSSTWNFEKTLQRSVEIYHRLKETFEYRNISTSTANQGGFSPNLNSNLDALDFLIETIIKKNMKLGIDIFLGLDVGADDFYQNNSYKLAGEPQAKSPEDFLKYLNQLVKDYHVLYLEDAFARQDKNSQKKLLDLHGNFGYIAKDYMDGYGIDDMKKMFEEKLVNSIVIKVNRYPTLLNLFTTIEFCRKNNCTYIFTQEVSEVNQSFVADLSVGLQAPFVKLGAPVKGERVAKYNRLLEIEKILRQISASG